MTKFCKHPEEYECVYCKLDKLGVPEKHLKAAAYDYYQSDTRSFLGEDCNHCGGRAEPYMLHDSLWYAIADDTKEFSLCLACVRLRLGGELKLKHFTDVWFRLSRVPEKNHKTAKIGSNVKLLTFQMLRLLHTLQNAITN